MTFDREWQDGDDTLLYESGYNQAVKDVVAKIDGLLCIQDVDYVPASMTLKIIKHTLLNPEEDND